MDILLIGLGGLGKAILELSILKENHFKTIDLIEPKKLDFPLLKKFNLKHHRASITKLNIDQIFTPLLKGKDLVLDVSVNIDCMALMERCKKHGVMYINTSLENWEDETELYKRTLHYRVVDALNRFKVTKDGNNPTFICDHGFNPGMISHLTKLALSDYCCYLNNKGIGVEDMNEEKGKKMLENREDFANAAKTTKLRTIHISEIDTQSASIEMKKDTFYNTWSSVGLIEEGIDPVQFGYGTHEKGFPYKIERVDNMGFADIRGIDVLFKSVAINANLQEEKYIGYAIPHGEANTISKYLSTEGKGKVEYRPSVYYVYHPSYPAISSIQRICETRSKEHVLSLPEIKEGFDSIGAHLFFDNGDRWWTGSILTVERVKKLGLKYSGPTEVQVAISLLSAINWIKNNRNRGILFPEDLPYRELIEYCYPYLGLFYSDKITSIKGKCLEDFIEKD